MSESRSVGAVRLGVASSCHAVRVLCVDDTPEIARMLERMIVQEPGIDSAGVLSSADDVVRQAECCIADIVVIDLTMPGRAPLAAIRELTRKSRFRVIAYSGYSDDATVRSAMEAGASDVVCKDTGSSAILESIRRVARLLRQSEPAPA